MFQTPFQTPLRVALALVALLLSSACSHGGHETGPYLGIGGDGDTRPPPNVDACETPNNGCSCDRPDEVVDCGQVDRRSGDYVSCSIGKRTCGADDTWGDCVGDSIATMSAPSGGQRTQGLGTSQACIDNPCDPYCQRVVDDSGGLNVDGGPFTTDGGLGLKATIPLPAGNGCTSLVMSPATQTVTVSAINSTFIQADYF
ncbi:MAG: hypothetical protein ABIQ16_06455, partial [Polyangiaceae bacterium]